MMRGHRVVASLKMMWFQVSHIVQQRMRGKHSLLEPWYTAVQVFQACRIEGSCHVFLMESCWVIACQSWTTTGRSKNRCSFDLESRLQKTHQFEPYIDMCKRESPVRVLLLRTLHMNSRDHRGVFSVQIFRHHSFVISSLRSERREI